MKVRTYEMRAGEWHEVEPQRRSRTGSLLRGIGALAVWLGSSRKRRSQ
jgi:hypothetical protein